MDSDLVLVLGIVFAALSVPSILGALADGRPPRLAALMLLFGAALVVVAIQRNPVGYTISDIPDAFVRVIGSFGR